MIQQFECTWWAEQASVISRRVLFWRLGGVKAVFVEINSESIRQILARDYGIYFNVTAKTVAGWCCIDTHIFSLINQECFWMRAGSV